MRLTTSSTLALLALAAQPAFAQNATFLAELAQTLSSMGLTSLVSAVSTINSTTTGQQLLAQLGNGSQTVFLPNNEAFTGVPTNISSNPELLANVISYHVLPGTFNINSTQTFPNTTIGRTLLGHSSNLVFLEGDRNQVLAWANRNGSTTILNQNTNVTVLNSTSLGNLTLHVTDAVIDVPGELTAAIAANNLTSFAAALSAGGLLDTLNFAHGVTVFAPTDAAFAAVQANLSQVQSNATLLQTILKNHVVNGSSVYTGTLQGGTDAVSAAGEKIDGNWNSTGGFVTSGNATAQIVTPDILLWNGVLHVIDRVLLNEDSDAGAASSAVSSASSAATASTTATGPIGFTPTPTSANGGSGGGGSNGGSNTSNAAASHTRVQFPLVGMGVAGLVTVLGAVVGGGLLAL